MGGAGLGAGADEYVNARKGLSEVGKREAETQGIGLENQIRGLKVKAAQDYMNPTTDVFEKRVAALEGGAAALASGIKQLRDGNAQLAAGLSKLSSGGGQLHSGLNQLTAGAGALEIGLMRPLPPPFAVVP